MRDHDGRLCSFTTGILIRSNCKSCASSHVTRNQKLRAENNSHGHPRNLPAGKESYELQSTSIPDIFFKYSESTLALCMNLFPFTNPSSLLIDYNYLIRQDLSSTQNIYFSFVKDGFRILNLSPVQLAESSLHYLSNPIVCCKKPVKPNPPVSTSLKKPCEICTTSIYLRHLTLRNLTMALQLPQYSI
jgi:hypothetical protein